MSQIDNPASVQGDDSDDGVESGNGSTAAADGGGTKPTRARTSSKRAPAAGKSTPRKRKPAAGSTRTTTKSSRSDKSTAESSTSSATTADEDEAVTGEAATAEVATSEPSLEDPTSISAADTIIPPSAESSVEPAVEPDDAAELTEAPSLEADDDYLATLPPPPPSPIDHAPLDIGSFDDVPAALTQEAEPKEAEPHEAEASAGDKAAPSTGDVPDVDYLATLPPPPVAPTEPAARRARPPKPERPAARDAVIDLDEATPPADTGPANVTIDAEDPAADLAPPRRALFWLRRQLHIPSQDPTYLATLPPPPSASIDLRNPDQPERAATGDSDADERLAVPALMAEDGSSTERSSGGATASALTDPAGEQPMSDLVAPPASDPSTTSAGAGGRGAGDGDGDTIAASTYSASADTSVSDPVELDDDSDPTVSVPLPLGDDEDVPRWVGRTDDAFAASPMIESDDLDQVDEAEQSDLVEAPMARTAEGDDGDDTIVSRAPKQSRHERRKEWRKVEQARRYAARRSVRFPILTRSIILWCLIFALAGVAAGGTAALFWSHFNTEIAELREKTSDFEKRSETAEARIEALRQQAVDDINRGKAELAPALAERGVVQAAQIFSPFVWFVDTFDNAGAASVGTAFAVNSTDKETFLITSYNTVKASRVRPAPVISLRKGGDVIAAELVNWDEQRDLAVIRIDRGSQAVLDWADNEVQGKQLGSRVYVVSGLGGAGASVNGGVVSDQIAQGFMHDARLGGQSQGAPMVTTDGKVVGVASQTYRPLNINTGEMHYSIRIELACETLLDCSTVARRPR